MHDAEERLNHEKQSRTTQSSSHTDWCTMLRSVWIMRNRAELHNPPHTQTDARCWGASESWETAELHNPPHTQTDARCWGASESWETEQNYTILLTHRLMHDAEERLNHEKQSRTTQSSSHTDWCTMLRSVWIMRNRAELHNPPHTDWCTMLRNVWIMRNRAELHNPPHTDWCTMLRNVWIMRNRAELHNPPHTQTDARCWGASESWETEQNYTILLTHRLMHDAEERLNHEKQSRTTQSSSHTDWCTMLRSVWIMRNRAELHNPPHTQTDARCWGASESWETEQNYTILLTHRLMHDAEERLNHEKQSRTTQSSSHTDWCTMLKSVWIMRNRAELHNPPHTQTDARCWGASESWETEQNYTILLTHRLVHDAEERLNHEKQSRTTQSSSHRLMHDAEERLNHEKQSRTTQSSSHTDWCTMLRSVWIMRNRAELHNPPHTDWCTMLRSVWIMRNRAELHNPPHTQTDARCWGASESWETEQNYTILLTHRLMHDAEERLNHEKQSRTTQSSSHTDWCTMLRSVWIMRNRAELHNPPHTQTDARCWGASESWETEQNYTILLTHRLMHDAEERLNHEKQSRTTQSSSHTDWCTMLRSVWIMRNRAELHNPPHTQTDARCWGASESWETEQNYTILLTQTDARCWGASESWETEQNYTILLTHRLMHDAEERLNHEKQQNYTILLTHRLMHDAEERLNHEKQSRTTQSSSHTDWCTMLRIVWIMRNRAELHNPPHTQTDARCWGASESWETEQNYTILLTHRLVHDAEERLNHEKQSRTTQSSSHTDWCTMLRSVWIMRNRAELHNPPHTQTDARCWGASESWETEQNYTILLTQTDARCWGASESWETEQNYTILLTHRLMHDAEERLNHEKQSRTTQSSSHRLMHDAEERLNHEKQQNYTILLTHRLMHDAEERLNHEKQSRTTQSSSHTDWCTMLRSVWIMRSRTTQSSSHTDWCTMLERLNHEKQQNYTILLTHRLVHDAEERLNHEKQQNYTILLTHRLMHDAGASESWETEQNYTILLTHRLVHDAEERWIMRNRAELHNPPHTQTGARCWGASESWETAELHNPPHTQTDARCWGASESWETEQNYTILLTHRLVHDAEERLNHEKQQNYTILLTHRLMHDAEERLNHEKQSRTTQSSSHTDWCTMLRSVWIMRNSRTTQSSSHTDWCTMLRSAESWETEQSYTILLTHRLVHDAEERLNHEKQQNYTILLTHRLMHDAGASESWETEQNYTILLTQTDARCWSVWIMRNRAELHNPPHTDWCTMLRSVWIMRNRAELHNPPHTQTGARCWGASESWETEQNYTILLTHRLMHDAEERLNHEKQSRTTQSSSHTDWCTMLRSVWIMRNRAELHNPPHTQTDARCWSNARKVLHWSHVQICNKWMTSFKVMFRDQKQFLKIAVKHNTSPRGINYRIIYHILY